QLRPHLRSSSFAIEMEMITKMARLGQEIYSVPISYHSRAGESSLDPFRDGSRILKMFVQNLVWKPTPTPAPARSRFEGLKAVRKHTTNFYERLNRRDG